MSFGDPVVLEPDDVPPSIRYLIPLGRRWGIGDDIYRDQAAYAASAAERVALVRTIREAPEDLWVWLVGPEAEAARPSNAYVAFTCLTMAFDMARTIIDRENQSENPENA